MGLGTRMDGQQHWPASAKMRPAGVLQPWERTLSESSGGRGVVGCSSVDSEARRHLGDVLAGRFGRPSAGGILCEVAVVPVGGHVEKDPEA